MWETADQVAYVVLIQIIMIVKTILTMHIFLDKQKFTFKKVLCWSVMVTISYSIFIPNIIDIGFYTSINCIVLCYLLYEGAILHKSLCISFGLGINIIAEMLAQLFIDQFMAEYLFDDKWRNIILQLISMSFILTIVIILKSRNPLFKSRGQSEAIIRREIIAFSMVAIASMGVVCLGVLIYTGDMQVINNKLFLFTIMIGAVVLDLSLITIIDRSTRTHYYQGLNRIIENQLRKQLNYYERLEQVNRETQAIKHDIKNHMLAMTELLENGEMEELKKYIEDIRQSITINKRFFKTGNPIADAILNEKYWRACENNINVTIDVQFSKNMNIDYVDICTILSNGIDNAIEACTKIELDKERAIKIIGRIQFGYLMIQILNTTQEDIMIKNNAIKTSKKDKQLHGYGLSNIKNSVEKYKGQFTLSFNEGYFRLEVIINTSYVQK